LACAVFKAAQRDGLPEGTLEQQPTAGISDEEHGKNGMIGSLL